jgi:hypothetical protein
MSSAWETTVDDVLNVLKELGVKKTEEEADTILDNLDTDKIEIEALRGDNMDEQIDGAYLEIKEQIIEIIEMGIV